MEAKLQDDKLPPLGGASVPRATYRVQLHAGFDFAQATAIVPYLQALGISHLYTSPYLRARAGSTHGYDIVDHRQLNPEIGDEAAFDKLCETLSQHGLKQLVDVVPNHMGVLQADNGWWLDVLANGPASAHAQTFDIDWAPVEGAVPQVLMPVLGGQYGEVLESGELVLVYDDEVGGFRIDYHEHRFPLAPRDVAAVLGAVPPPAGIAGRALALRDAFGALPQRDDDDPARRAQRRERIPALQGELRALAGEAGSPARDWIAACMRRFNGTAGDPRSFDALDALIGRQAWRASFWRVAGDEINYRRFFDVNTLAALRMEREPVFEAAHARLYDWLAEGRIDGLRIDHPDGLADPRQYFERLQAAFVARQRAAGVESPRALYVLIEKILAPHEHFPASWPVHGDTGYRFGQLVNGLFVDGRHAQAFDRLYRDFVGETVDYEAELLQAKRDVMSQALAADLHVLTERCWRLARSDRRTRDYTRNGLRLAIGELAAAFPVYRTYLGGDAPDPDALVVDKRHLDWALAAAKREGRAEASTLDWLHRLLLDEAGHVDPSQREAWLGVVRRFQQFTAPVMAKSMEDTAFYRYHRLVALNEVGGEPRVFGTSVAAFHAANLQRQRFAPHCMLGTSTHDSKRSEDVRARLDVLSEMPEAWARTLQRWRELNAPRAERAEGEVGLLLNEEMLLYQTLVGVWPLEPLDDDGLANLRTRVQDYMRKALREAKVSTSWLRPDEAHEAAITRFIDMLLGRLEPNPFLSDLRGFVDQLAPFGAWNSLNQVLFKLTSPGVPDVYQGCECWDFSLVDPDNRRPVDYLRRREALATLQDGAAGDRPSLLARLREHWTDGQAKLFLVWQLLQWRAARESLFRDGRYLALEVEGPAADHVVAYARVAPDGGAWALVVGTRLLHGLTGGDWACIGRGEAWTSRWAGTRLRLPTDAPQGWTDRLSGRRFIVESAPSEGVGDAAAMTTLSLGPLLQSLPFVALEDAPASA